MDTLFREQEHYLDLLKKCLTASIYDESGWRVVQPNLKKKHSLLRVLRSWLLRALAKRSLMLVRRKAMDTTAREGGDDWPCFGFTMVGHKRLNNTQMCVQDILKNNVPGDFIETGVWRGGCCIFMRALLKAYRVSDRTVWVADSFEGMPKPDKKYPQDKNCDLSQIEALQISKEAVENNFKRFNLFDDQVKFLKGWFKDTLPTAPIDKIALLRLDGDLYESTMDALKALYHKVSPGGYVIVDDYRSWECCREAVNDYFKAQHQPPPDVKIIDNHAVYWKK